MKRKLEALKAAACGSYWPANGLPRVVRLQILPHGSETLLWACFPTPLPSQTWRKRFFPPPKWQVVRFPAHPGFGTRFETGQRRKACPQQCFSKHVVRLKSYHKPSGGLEILPQARWARPSGHYEYFMHNAPQRGGREGEGGLLPQDYKTCNADGSRGSLKLDILLFFWTRRLMLCHLGTTSTFLWAGQPCCLLQGSLL